MREWLFAREAMRRLGFQPDELFFAYEPTGRVISSDGDVKNYGKPVIALILKAQGLQFVWTIGAVDLPADEIKQAWFDAADLWNNSPDNDWRDAGWLKSEACQRSVQLIAMLLAKGFTFPGNFN
jgi:hypothetical protein